MSALESDLRRQLENVIIEAREVAEAAARSKLTNLGVAAPEAFNNRDREIRNRLRARGRQAGDARNADKAQSIDQLTQELAYEFWHRMLFARFLAENGLLIDPDHEVSVDLDYCEEDAASKGATNGYVLAARYASTMLPQIFRTDDVLLEIEFAPEQRLALEKLLASLPRQTFVADDSLGWVYQFWQTAAKKRVNDIGDKINGRTLPAVTQLFTEHYMVEFLLHNTIGAWWCGRHGVQGPQGGAGVPVGTSPVEMAYLRWRDDGTTAAGKFEGWPKTLADFKMLDPCCGSGHFLVSGFNLLVPLRMHDEGLTAEKACDAVLRDNLFGLELDPRCTQIAAFALALAAWKHPNAGGYRPLPPLNIACSGQGVTGKKEEWLSLANGNDRLREGMDRIYKLFQQAPHLGSLIDPRREKGNMYEAGFGELQPLLNSALLKNSADAELAAIGVAAKGIAKAAELLLGEYTLVATNVPYLGSGSQGSELKAFFKDYANDARFDLATVFMQRCFDFCRPGGTVSIVTPHNWLFQASYERLRERLLREKTVNSVARLGPRAFETITGEVVNVALVVVTTAVPCENTNVCVMDVSSTKVPQEKAKSLRQSGIRLSSQFAQLKNSNSRITFGDATDSCLLSEYANAWQGLATGDLPMFGRYFWELPSLLKDWRWFQSTVETSSLFSGREQIIFWENGLGKMKEVSQNPFRGDLAWDKPGVAVTQMTTLPVTLYTGEAFDNNMSVITPFDPLHVPAIWAYCSSPEYVKNVRQIDQSLKVTNASLTKVPFDLAHWQAVAAEKFPDGLPGPHSDDPTQWLFKGGIEQSADPLQVAVARLLGYRWPEQLKTPDAIDKLADSDGILCLPGVRGEAAAAERLLEVLRAAYGKNWSDSVLHKLLMDTGCKAGTTLEDWLRNSFFEQHCKRFYNRPFVWHIWDGRKDGFSALVNYHKLTQKGLENLTYSYLGDWITAQSKSDKAGADSRLGAAQDLQAKLKLILAGEPPYDIFVRWKPLHEQAIGWQPDLNDGVRMNIRPFIEAEILRKTPNIKWTKDRGNDPERNKAEYPWYWNGNDPDGDRVNDVHLTNEKKAAVRTRMKGAK